MKHELPNLEYDLSSLSPYISEETMNYHYTKHLKAYIDNLNNLIIWTEFENMSLEDIIKKAPAWPIFNNAWQAWNHRIYFWIMTPNFNQTPWEKTIEMINKDFWSFENFKELFKKSCLWNFGSSWTWLVINETTNSLEILNTSNWDNPLTKENKKTLLWIDLWEHSYYIDTRNDRAKYVDNFFSIINWEKIEDLI